MLKVALDPAPLKYIRFYYFPVTAPLTACINGYLIKLLGRCFLPSTAIRSESRMIATSKKELFVATAYTESH